MKSNKKIYIIALAATGEGISGSDRIFIEFARHWSKTHLVTIITSAEGYQMCKRLKHKKSANIKFEVIQLQIKNFIINYLQKIIASIKWSFSKKDLDISYIYSASEFWMDSLPGFLLKLKKRRIKWIATWYQTAPNLLKGFSETQRENHYRISALLYWLMQLPIKPLIKKYADFVLVNNEEEHKQFANLKKQKRTVVVLGAVDTDKISKIKSRNSNLPQKYDAVFQGRFHPQKGVVELVEIWKKVADVIPSAQLVMIGDGPLMKTVKSKVKSLKLEKNVKLFGYLFDGPEKYKIFSQSKLVVHPSFYDSGGMASAEAMAFGIPAIGFNLKSYKSYYPKGMIKVSVGNLNAFADKVNYLLKNEKLRNRIGKEAETEIMARWSWEKRAEEVLRKIT
jgi:glycosyltransferase involved in cell wall biosynthesis